ncbi:helix-turn-helix domain-containing protein [Eubacteriales bacterium OttesenSCG-928-K08]|nr:helix-turn-helix domain-containing protein [Eubacteriales bacterium OttesenSCG-928-K08]
MTQHTTSLDQLPLTLNARDIAECLGISRAQAYSLLKTEGFPTLRIGRRLLVPRHSFVAWMEEKTGRTA